MDGTDQHTIALARTLDGGDVGALRAALAEALARGPVRLDASGTERVSTSGLMVLLSAAVSARAMDRPLVMADPSPALEEAIETLGLADQFAPMIPSHAGNAPGQ
ncbi:STAS domain-containing protein [Pelagibacterium montanilacus]|uniref:STAS domain-containing protein n=1 Tax=Pelagibacterium montanilacus TaxID=2185280 RepID=UPI000F8C9D80|nr:STAS domain-containing protein [Pelagibacterium montanilacus]